MDPRTDIQRVNRKILDRLQLCLMLAYATATFKDSNLYYILVAHSVSVFVRFSCPQEPLSLFTADIKPLTLRYTLSQKPCSAQSRYICEFFRKTTVDVSGTDRRNRGGMLVHRGSQLEDTTGNRIATGSTICPVHQAFQA